MCLCRNLFSIYSLLFCQTKLFNRSHWNKYKWLVFYCCCCFLCIMVIEKRINMIMFGWRMKRARELLSNQHYSYDWLTNVDNNVLFSLFYAVACTFAIRTYFSYMQYYIVRFCLSLLSSVGVVCSLVSFEFRSPYLCKRTVQHTPAVSVYPYSVANKVGKNHFPFALLLHSCK